MCRLRARSESCCSTAWCWDFTSGFSVYSLRFCRKASGRIRFLWCLRRFSGRRLNLLRSRITSVPWDQLGYSQVDNLLLTRLAPVTGVYGISFVLVAANAFLVAALLAIHPYCACELGVGAVLLIVLLQLGSFSRAKAVRDFRLRCPAAAQSRCRLDKIWVGRNGMNTRRGFWSRACAPARPAYIGMPHGGCATASAAVQPECSAAGRCCMAGSAVAFR